MATIAGTSFDDTLVGTDGSDVIDAFAGNDLLLGNLGDDVLRGGAGADTLDGGGGNDTAGYEDTPSVVMTVGGITREYGVFVDLANSANNQWGATGDVFVSVERVFGTIYSDYLSGSDADNVLIGSAGNDVLVGLGGNDILLGGDGDDVLIGGAGSDILNGDAGFDIASYTDAGSGVILNLGSSALNGGEALGDVYSSVEGLLGSQFGDAISGDGSDNYLDGQGGADIIDGGSGNDTLIGGDGNDVLIGGLGGDLLIGGAGIDLAYYGGSTTGVYASLGYSFVNTNDAAGDNYDSIEWLFGSAFNDILIGDAGDNLLLGNDGDDILRGGGGTDFLSGGAGRDVYGYGVGDGIDYIGGFSGSEDTISISSQLYASATAAFAAVVEDPVSHQSYLYIDANNILVIGVPLSELSVNNFTVF